MVSAFVHCFLWVQRYYCVQHHLSTKIIWFKQLKHILSPQLTTHYKNYRSSSDVLLQDNLALIHSLCVILVCYIVTCWWLQTCCRCTFICLCLQQQSDLESTHVNWFDCCRKHKQINIQLQHVCNHHHVTMYQTKINELELHCLTINHLSYFYNFYNVLFVVEKGLNKMIFVHK